MILVRRRDFALLLLPGLSVLLFAVLVLLAHGRDDTFVRPANSRQQWKVCGNCYYDKDGRLIGCGPPCPEHVLDKSARWI